jgi:hypothetical protein
LNISAAAAIPPAIRQLNHVAFIPILLREVTRPDASFLFSFFARST